jgi:drug/metabolite transporter (DMT)-like permease
MNPNATLRLVAALCTVLLLWGSAFAATHFVLQQKLFTPGELALFRYGIASLVLAALTLWSPLVRPRLADMPRLIACAALGVGIYTLALNYGQLTVSPGAASFIVNTAPLFATLFACVMLKERLPAPGWVALGISLVGMALITLSEGDGRVSSGALLVFVSAITWALYQIVQKPLLPRYGALGVVSYAIWGGTVMFLPFLPGLIPAAAGAPALTNATVIYLGVLPGAAAYLAWSYVLTRLPVSRATPFLYLVPVLALLIAWVGMGERPHALSVLGGVIAIAGVALGHVTRARPAVAA